MSIEEIVASDVAEFVRREVTKALEANGPDEYMFNMSLWATGTGYTEYWTIYDGYGSEHDNEAVVS